MGKLRPTFRLSLVCQCLLFFFAVTPAHALQPHTHVSQYGHTSWRTQDGAFNGSPNVITQTTDGYIWIGTNLGLVRFDGIRFISWNPPAGRRLLDSRIFSLLGTHDGSLWIGTGYGLSRWKDGELTNYPELSGRMETLLEGENGEVWLVRTQMTDQAGPLCRVKDAGFHCYGPRDGIPFALGTQLTRGDSGELWIGGYSELCRWKEGSCSSYFSNASRRPETMASIRKVASAPDGSVWAVVENPGRVLQLQVFRHGQWTQQTFSQIPLRNSDVSALFVDRNGDPWIGTSTHGMFRIQGQTVEHFGNGDGLSSDAVSEIYQDSEGTIWVVTSTGIDNFRDLKVTSYSAREGLSADAASSVVAAHDGTVWVGNHRAIDSLRNNKLLALREEQGLPGRNVTTMFEDHLGRLWVGVDDGLWVYDRGKFQAVRHADGSSLGIVFSITEDVARDIWVRAANHLDRIHELKLQTESTSPQISTSYILAADPRGGIFLGLVDGALVHYQAGKEDTIASNEVGNRRQIRDLLVEPDGSVWGTTLDEVARWKDGLRRNLTTSNGLPCDGLFALVQDDRGALWIYSQCGLIEIDKEQLESWWQNPDQIVQFRLLDVFDGVQAGLTSLKPQAVRSPDGRLWFVNGQMLQTLDPNHPLQNTVAPLVHIEEIVADRKRSEPQDRMRFPARTRDVEVDYTALSFANPQKVRFRYKLDGRDKDWQDPGTRRQAFYNDLGPGEYRFHVIASNDDGVWSEKGAALEFKILPAFYQTKWFLLLMVIAVGYLAWAVYQWRIHLLARRLELQFEARLSERTHIAQDLHDTLLQGFISASMQLGVADQQLPQDWPAKPVVTRVLQLMQQVIEEGRQAVRGMRMPGADTHDLQRTFAVIPQQLAVDRPVNFRVLVGGQVRPLHPLIRDEIYRIGREAVVNAFRHSQAATVEVELEYGDRQLRIVVRDDGCGIDPRVLQSGRDGHWGLSGMRERAGRIGARLKIWSTAGAGTEVELSIPSAIAYESDEPTGFLHRLTRTKHQQRGDNPQKPGTEL